MIPGELRFAIRHRARAMHFMKRKNNMYTKSGNTSLFRSPWRFSDTKAALRRWLIRSVAILAVATAAAPAYSASDNCPSVNGIGNMKTSANVSASYSGIPDASTGIATVTYTFTGVTTSPVVDGVPGLISYCVYPATGNLPSAINSVAIGFNDKPFVAKMAAKGSFSFTRDGGNPSNLPLGYPAAHSYLMGNATWPGQCATDATGVMTCQPTMPTTQTVLLHINDNAECTRLYGAGDTCWVYPGNTPPNPPLCNGEPACKSAVIDLATGEFDDKGYPFVPLGKLLHITYTYVIVNQPTNTYDMIFHVPTGKTQDINAGGGKDYFGCEQTPDTAPGKMPGSFTTVPSYQTTGMYLDFFPSTGKGCAQSRFQITAPAQITLKPGDSRSFTVDMITRKNAGGKQEFTSAGEHVLNSGFTVKWFQSNDNLLHSFTTGKTPLGVNAQ